MLSCVFPLTMGIFFSPGRVLPSRLVAFGFELRNRPFPPINWGESVVIFLSRHCSVTRLRNTFHHRFHLRRCIALRYSTVLHSLAKHIFIKCACLLAYGDCPIRFLPSLLLMMHLPYYSSMVIMSVQVRHFPASVSTCQTNTDEG